MTPDLSAPGEPLWWTLRLERALKERASQIAIFDSYYQGDHPLAFASPKFLEAFGGLFEAFADNWCALVVDAEAERLRVEGFRFGDSPKADDDAWTMWQANGLDGDSGIAFTEALIHGESAAIVWGDSDNEPVITMEHPREVIVENVAGSRRKRAAALKVFTDLNGDQLATLYLPDSIYKWRRPGKASSGLYVPQGYGSFGSRTTWIPREVDNETWPLRNPLGVVPVVPLRNRPRLLIPSRSELHDVIPVQAGVNKLIADLLVNSEYTAFKQRWASGMDIPVDPETHQAIEPFRMAVQHFLIGEDPDTKFGTLEQSDPSSIVKPVELLVQHIASQSRTPPHYFYLGGGQPPSGESIKSAETGLVKKTWRQSRYFGEDLEEIVRIGFAVKSDKRSKFMGAETIWGDMESRTESEHVDAVMKMQTLGVPQQQLWEDLGYGPTQIARFKAMLAEERLNGAPQAAPAAPLVPQPMPAA